MKFIETDDGGYVAVDQIVRLSRVRVEGVIRTRVELRDGTAGRARQPALDPSELARMMCPVIPAQPGFELLRLYEDEYGVEVMRSPVLGWRIEQYGVTPIGIEMNDSECGTIKLPDGRVMEVESCVHASEEEWVTHERAAKAKRQA
jgi:hypothetical protein